MAGSRISSKVLARADGKATEAMRSREEHGSGGGSSSVAKNQARGHAQRCSTQRFLVGEDRDETRAVWNVVHTSGTVRPSVWDTEFDKNNGFPALGASSGMVFGNMSGMSLAESRD